MKTKINSPIPPPYSFNPAKEHSGQKQRSKPIKNVTPHVMLSEAELVAELHPQLESMATLLSELKEILKRQDVDPKVLLKRNNKPTRRSKPHIGPVETIADESKPEISRDN